MSKDKNRKSHASEPEHKPLNFVDHIKEVLDSRDRTKKILGTIFFAVPIILVFVFFGLPQNDLSGGASAAQVNKVFISLKDFSNEEARIQKMQEYYAQMFGQPITFDPERQKMMRRQAVESLIQQELLSQAAEDEGFLVSSKEILEKIKEIPEFKKDGFFTPTYYFQILEANSLTPAKFENSIKKQIQAIRTKEFFESSAKPSLLEMNKMKELKATQWNVQFVKLDKEELGKKTVVSTEEIQKSLTQEEFVKRAKSYFEANSNQYDTPEKISAQVIMINFKPGDADSQKQAEVKIKEVFEKTKSEDFGKLAQTYSEDIGTKSKKGDLGWFSRGEKDPTLEQAAFGLEAGQVSQPIKSFVSYQLVKVNEKKPMLKAEFEAVKNKVASELLARDMFDVQAKGLEDAMKKGDFAEVNQVLAKLNVKWEETGFFNLDSIQVPKLAEKELKAAVFQLSPAKKMGQNLVNLRGAKYLVALKEVKMDSASLDIKRESMTVAQQKGSQLQEDWIQFVRKDAKINVNPLIFQ